MKLTIGKVMDFLITKMIEGYQNNEIKKPLTWALHETWKWSETQESPRKEKP